MCEYCAVLPVVPLPHPAYRGYRPGCSLHSSNGFCSWSPGSIQFPNTSRVDRLRSVQGTVHHSKYISLTDSSQRF